MTEAKPKRTRPADEYFKLRRQAGAALARDKVTSDADALLPGLREIDGKLMGVLLEALDQCATSGKLHPEIARHLAHTLKAGLDGKLPLAWPEPSGQRSTWSTTAEPEDVAVLYLAAGREKLLDNDRHLQNLIESFGVSERNVDHWRVQRWAEIVTSSDGHISGSCYGLAVHAPSREKFSSLVAEELEKAAAEYRRRRGMKPLRP